MILFVGLRKFALPFDRDHSREAVGVESMRGQDTPRPFLAIAGNAAMNETRIFLDQRFRIQSHACE